METWRLVDIEYSNDPFMNLAVEEAIPRMVGERKAPTTVRFWHNSNTIVIGCFQSAKLEVNMEACKETGTKIVRRFTGGGCDYHYWGEFKYVDSFWEGNPMGPDREFQSGFPRVF